MAVEGKTGHGPTRIETNDATEAALKLIFEKVLAAQAEIWSALGIPIRMVQ